MRKTGPKCRKRLVTRKWCEIRQKVSVLQRQRRLQISRVKNVGRVVELSGVAFCLAPPDDGLLIQILQSLHIHFWWMAVLLGETPVTIGIGFVMFVGHEISFSNTAETVWHGVTKFYGHISADIVYRFTGYDVITYFRWELIGQQRPKIPPPTAACRISRERFKGKIHTIMENPLHKHARNDVTRCFRSAAKMSLNTAHKCAKPRSGRTKSRICRPLFHLYSPKHARTSVPTSSRALLDMTSEAASNRHLSRFENGRKCRIQRLCLH